MSTQPLTADGVPFTPGMRLWDETGRGLQTEASDRWPGRWSFKSPDGRENPCTIRSGDFPFACYSTLSAALNARATRLRRELAEIERAKVAKLAEVIEAEMAWRKATEPPPTERGPCPCVSSEGHTYGCKCGCFDGHECESAYRQCSPA